MVSKQGRKADKKVQCYSYLKDFYAHLFSSYFISSNTRK